MTVVKIVIMMSILFIVMGLYIKQVDQNEVRLNDVPGGVFGSTENMRE